MSDMVNHPSHYTAGEVECIDAIKAAVTDLQGFDAYCTGNAIKYLWRWKRKGGTQDLSKAVWYIQRLISTREAGVQSGSMPRVVLRAKADVLDAYEKVEALSKGAENG